VKSAVIRVKRNNVEKLDCDEVLFKKIVKSTFGVRRKTLRNGLKTFNLSQEILKQEIFSKRPEQLSVDDFVRITKEIQENHNFSTT